MTLGDCCRWGFKAENNLIGPRQVQLIAGGPLDVTGIGFQGLDLGLLRFLQFLLLVDLAVEPRDVLLHFATLMQKGHEKQGDAAADNGYEDEESE